MKKMGTIPSHEHELNILITCYSVMVLLLYFMHCLCKYLWGAVAVGAQSEDNLWKSALSFCGFSDWKCLHWLKYLLGPFSIFIYLFLMNGCMCMDARMSLCAYDDQKTTYRNYSLSTMLVLDIELRLPGLAAFDELMNINFEIKEKHLY